jgi:hypothetical protein
MNIHPLTTKKKVYLATKIIADYLSLRANKVEAT